MEQSGLNGTKSVQVTLAIRKETQATVNGLRIPQAEDLENI